MEIVNLLSVWIHITSAVLLVGAVFFLRFTVLKYGERTGGLSEELKRLLINRYVHVGIGLLIVMLISGLYNMSVNNEAWKASTSTPPPHAIFGMKFILFLAFLALTVMTGMFKDAKERLRPKLLTISSILGIIIVFFSVWLGKSY